MPGSQKLSHLLQLADQGPVMRAALAEEVAELLTAWPHDYPDSMKGVCEALLARAVRDVDAGTRARLRIILCADAELAARVLPRESASQKLLAAARAGEAVEDVLAQCVGVDAAMAHQILDDETGAALAVACKGANIDRATFSALVLLIHPRRERTSTFVVLDAFDNAPANEAVRLLDEWREAPSMQAVA